MAHFLVRPMVEADIPQVVLLEREAFPTQVPGTSFQRELSNGLATYLVIRSAPEGGVSADGQKPEEAVLGYAGLWFIVDEAHLTALAVQEAERRRGIGQQLLAAALELAIERAASLMTLEVRVSNHGAQALYEKFGFKRVGVRRGYYTDNHEDAYLMTVENINSAEYRAKLQQLQAGSLVTKSDT